MTMPFDDTDELAAAYDDLPLWSAPFGLALLDAVRLTDVRAALDVGCGAGFPLVELAERLGAGARVVGLDPWRSALRRVRAKLALREVDRVSVVAAAAEAMPFADGVFDLLVSNNGLNNVADAAAALAECRRVARPDAQLVMTVNLPDTMRELYAVFAGLLAERGAPGAVAAMHAHIAAKRPSVSRWLARLAAAGFTVRAARPGEFRMRYATGAALFRQWFIRLGFLPPWRELLPAGEAPALLAELERRLDELAAVHGELALTVPFVCLASRRA